MVYDIDYIKDNEKYTLFDIEIWLKPTECRYENGQYVKDDTWHSELQCVCNGANIAKFVFENFKKTTVFSGFEVGEKIMTGYSENTYRSASVMTQGNAVISDVLSTVMFSVSNKNEAFDIIKAFEKEYNTEIAVSWIRETDTEFKLAAVEATQAIHDAIVDQTVMDAVENIVLLEVPE